MAGGTANILPQLPMGQVQVDTYDIGAVISNIGGFTKVVSAFVILLTGTLLYYIFWDQLARDFIAKEEGVPIKRQYCCCRIFCCPHAKVAKKIEQLKKIFSFEFVY